MNPKTLNSQTITTIITTTLRIAFMVDCIGMTWTLIGVVIAIGLGIMIAVSNSGSKENIEIDRK